MKPETGGDGDFGVYPGEPDDGLVRLCGYSSAWNSTMTFTAKTCGLEWEG